MVDHAAPHRVDHAAPHRVDHQPFPGLITQPLAWLITQPLTGLITQPLTGLITIQYNTIELYCPVNGKFVYSVRVKVNKNTIVIKKIRINKYIKNEHLNFYQHN